MSSNTLTQANLCLNITLLSRNTETVFSFKTLRKEQFISFSSYPKVKHLMILKLQIGELDISFKTQFYNTDNFPCDNYRLLFHKVVFFVCFYFILLYIFSWVCDCKSYYKSYYNYKSYNRINSRPPSSGFILATGLFFGVSIRSPTLVMYQRHVMCQSSCSVNCEMGTSTLSCRL